MLIERLAKSMYSGDELLVFEWQVLCVYVKI